MSFLSRLMRRILTSFLPTTRFSLSLDPYFRDPWPRKKNAKRRLTYHTFLEKYKKVLKLGGQIHFKTDNANLFAGRCRRWKAVF